MNTKYLTYILTIAKYQNMTKAAEKLYIAQSSLSQYLTKLEQEIGSPLFFRTKGKMVLTSAGQMYVDAAKEVIQIKNRLYKNIAVMESAGHLTVGATSKYSIKVLSAVIPQFQTQFPQVSVELIEGKLDDITKMLLEGQLDLGLLASTHISPFENQCIILKNEEVLLGVPSDHPYCAINRGNSISAKSIASAFANDSFLLCKKGALLRDIAENIFFQSHHMPSSVFETNSISAIQTMLKNGSGIAFIGESQAERSDAIHYYRLTPRPPYRYNLLAYRQNWTMNEMENTFCTYITEYFHQNSLF